MDAMIPELWYTEVVQPAPDDSLNKLRVETYWVRTMKSVVPIPELDNVLGLPKAHGFLFHGAAGTGKRTLARALAGSLVKQGYSYVHVSGRDFNADLRSRVQFLFRQISEEHPMVLVLESMQSCCDSEDLAACLGQMAEVCRKENLPLVFVVIDEDEDNIPPLLRRQLHMCRFDLPDLDERIAFYDAAIGKRFPLQEGLRTRDLAIAAEGLQLRQLVQTLRFMQLALKDLAVKKYKQHYAMAESAIRNKELVVDMAVFRSIVQHLKTPEKASAAPIQILQSVAAAPAAPEAAPKKDAANSRTDILRESKSASDFFKNL